MSGPNTYESGTNTPNIPPDEQAIIWTGFLLSGQNPYRPVDFASLAPDTTAFNSLRSAVEASIGVPLSDEAMQQAIAGARKALSNRN